MNHIVRLGVAREMNVLSVTDHNNVGGIKEAIELCQELDVSFIPGIEIDCNFKGMDLHLLGYQIDWKNDDFKELEIRVNKAHLATFPQMIENLSKTGIDIDVNEVVEKSDGKPPTGELFAEVLLGNRKYQTIEQLSPYRAGGSRSDMPFINFYLDYFAQGKPAYVPVEYMPYTEAIDLIRSHGGIPIVAHPGLNFRGKEEWVSELLDRKPSA